MGHGFRISFEEPDPASRDSGERGQTFLIQVAPAAECLKWTCGSVIGGSGGAHDGHLARRILTTRGTAIDSSVRCPLTFYLGASVGSSTDQ